MIRFIIGLLLISSAGLLVYKASPIKYYMQPKQQRLFNIWRNDLTQLYKDSKTKKIFQNISQIEIHFTDPQVAEEFKDFVAPFRTTNAGDYVLKVGITRWIEAKEYGYVIQHELFDQNDDKLHEFGRTYKIGIIL